MPAPGPAPLTSHPVRPPSPARAPRARLSALVLLGALVATLLPAVVAPTAASAAPATRTPGRTIEPHARYQPQTTCSPQAKPGVVAFMRTTLAAYPGTGSSGIVRACAKGGRSEHKEGRAWDWRLSYSNPRQRAQASDMARWLFATDRYGNTRAQARRLGLMYVIWNRKIWSSSTPGAGWKPYTGADPHTSHMHFSFSVLGGQGKTSYWTGALPVRVPPVVPAPSGQPVPVAPAPAPGPPAGAGPVGGPVATVPPAAAPAQPPLDRGSVRMTVPADGRPVTSAFSLRAGRRYLLTASGTYRYGGGAMTADAECSRRPDGGRWRRTSAWERGSSGHLDLEVGGAPDEWVPRTDNGRGCDTRDHVYTRTVLATTDAPLSVRIADDGVGDNSGALQLQVDVLDVAESTD